MLSSHDTHPGSLSASALTMPGFFADPASGVWQGCGVRTPASGNETFLRTERRGDTLIIRVFGQLDFCAYHDFRRCYEQAPASVRRYAVDLADCTGLGCSAMAMLLLLRDHAGGGRDLVSLRNAPVAVLRELLQANIESLFRLE